MSKMRLDDQIRNRDKYMIPVDTSRIQPSPLRTSISAGYDFFVDENGVSQLGEIIFEREENMVLLGGSLFTLEKLFGVKSNLTVDTLNNIMGIATGGPEITDNKDVFVCLFGAGIGGCGDSMLDVKDVKYYEREIVDMVPLRITDIPLTVDEQEKYWFKKVDDEGRTAYYLKTFENTPEIKVLWADVEGEDGSAVQPGVHNTPDTNTTPIDTFIEVIFKISKKDIREWFQINGNVEQTRVNSIGLFTGIKVDLGNGQYDYKEVKLFSKLNIHNEMLTMPKDMTVIYRIYTS